jgi:long-chain acyl-CoA synthetase
VSDVPFPGRGEPIGTAGLAKTLEGMVLRLADHPRNRIAYYVDGRVASKPFPEILADVEQTARRLAALGVRKGMRVGMLASNSYAWVVHDLALIQLGVCSVAFPDETPAAELGGLAERHGLSLLLASSDLLPPYPLDQPVLFIDTPAGGRVTLREAPPAGPADDIPPAIVFSSGSSGRLKALKTSGCGTLQVIERFCSHFRFYHDDSFLVFLPLHSYQQRLMIYGCINYGVDLAVVKTGQLFQGLADFRPTLCLAPPILFESVQKQFAEAVRTQAWPRRAAFRLARALARSAPSAALRRRLRDACYGRLRQTFGGSMRLMWTGMAPVRRTMLEFFAETGLTVVEGYGLTESGPIAFNTPEENRIGAVGKPIFADSVRLTGDGEVIVERPAFLTTGYCDAEPADEAATYLAPGRIATGDIGYFDADGFLHLKGRKKEIIITGDGRKIHPEIVEQRLNRSHLVLQSAVFGQGLPELSAVLVVRRPQADGRAAQAWLAEVNRELLPEGLRIATAHVTGEEFSTANGLLTENLKLNRRAVFQRYQDLLSIRAPTSEPSPARR